MIDWYYAQSGRQTGPVDQATVQRLLLSGHIQPGDLVWNEGMTDWRPAATVPELAALLQPVQTQQPPAQNQSAQAEAAPYSAPPAPQAFQQPGAYPAPVPQGVQQPSGYSPPTGVSQPGGQLPPQPGFNPAQLEYGNGRTNSPMGPSYNGMAIGGFVTSLFGMPCFYCVGFAAAVTGLSLSLVALNGMKKGGNPTGRGFAVAGAIIGAVFLLIFLGFGLVLLIASFK